MRRFFFATVLPLFAALVACGAPSDADDDAEIEGTSEEALSGDEGLEYDVEDATDLRATEPPAGSFTARPPHSEDADDELAPANGIPVNRTIGKPKGGPVMTLHGGRVMSSATVYFIYYGDWSQNHRTQALHGSFARGLAANAWNRDWLGAARFYEDAQTDVAGKRIAFGKSIAVGAPRGAALTTDAVGKVVYDAISQHKLPLDPTGIYFVMTGRNVSQELEGKDCGWHTEGTMTFTTQTPMTADGGGADGDGGADADGGSDPDAGTAPTTTSQDATVRYAWVADSRRQHCSIYAKGARTPNSDYIADSQVTVIAHELAETLTDPNLDGFYEGNHSEIGDKCAWYFEHVVPMKGGALANIHDRRSGRNWLVQDLFKNKSCTLGAPR
jgi:hypothetical protein